MFELSGEDSAEIRRRYDAFTEGDSAAAAPLVQLIRERVEAYLKTTFRSELRARSKKLIDTTVVEILRELQQPILGDPAVRVTEVVTDAIESLYNQIAKYGKVHGRGKHKRMRATVSFERCGEKHFKRGLSFKDSGNTQFSTGGNERAIVRRVADSLTAGYGFDARTESPHEDFSDDLKCNAVRYALLELKSSAENNFEPPTHYDAICKCYGSGRNILNYKQLGQAIRKDQRTAKKLIREALTKVAESARGYCEAVFKYRESVGFENSGNELDQALRLSKLQLARHLREAAAKTENPAPGCVKFPLRLQSASGQDVWVGPFGNNGSFRLSLLKNDPTGELAVHKWTTLTGGSYDKAALATLRHSARLEAIRYERLAA